MKIRSVLALSILLFSLLPCLPVQGNPDEVTQNPTENYSVVGRWFSAQNAYTSNDVYASASFHGATVGYKTYDFDSALPDGCSISKVEVALEFYCLATESLAIRVSVDGGSSFSLFSNAFTLTEENTLWLDVTDYQDPWTKDYLIDENWRVEVAFYMTGGGSCYRDNMYFATTETLSASLKNMQDWQFHNPRQIQSFLEQNKTIYILTWGENDDWFIDERSQAIRVDEHAEGPYTLYDIYSGELQINYVDAQAKEQNLEWKSHIELTGNHNITYFMNGDWVTSDTETLFKQWDSGRTIYINHLWSNYTSKAFPVTDIKVRQNFKGKVYDVKTKGELDPKEGIIRKGGKTLTEQEYDTLMDLKDCGVPIGKFPPYLTVMQKGAWTAYLDWIPTRVTFTEGAEDEVIDCNWIGTNNTVAGDPTEFKADFTDLNETDGLSHFRCLHNNTGTFENTTWSDAWQGNWSITELTLNSTGDLTIAFRFYVNDTEGTEHQSTWCFFPTHTCPDAETIIEYREYGAGGVIPQNLTWIEMASFKFVKPVTDMVVTRQFSFDGFMLAISYVALACIFIKIVHDRLVKKEVKYSARIEE